MAPLRSPIVGLSMLAIAAGASTPARAAGPPAFSVELRDTADFWRNLQGGLRRGNTSLNKLSAAVTFDGEAAGIAGFRAYVQVFRTNAQSLSLARTGDIQTASNIEAPRVDRLFELWAEQSRGSDDDAGWLMVRGGVIDLNRTFDSISTAGLFLSSSHGIAPDLSKSGLSGPSIFPVAGPAIQAGWRPVKTLALNAGVFAEPDPERQDVFADLPIRHGAIVIGQADWTPARDVQLSLGVWRYTVRQPGAADAAHSLEPRPGVYAFAQAPTSLPGHPNGWVRAGLADGRVQQVAAYVGAGLVWKGPGARRELDQYGVALAHAVISREARDGFGLPAAETSLEASYSFKLGPYLHLQPDVQRIFHPAGAAHLKDATAVALRVVAAWKGPGGDPP